jgi:hypothetical protein
VTILEAAFSKNASIRIGTEASFWRAVGTIGFDLLPENRGHLKLEFSI